LALKDYNAAISLLEDEFEVDNDQRFQLFIHRSICLCYGSQKRFEEMAVDARAAISVDGTHFAGHSSLGRALFHLRDFEGAVVALTESLSLQQDAISGRQSPTSRPFEIRSNPRDLAIDQDFLDQAKKSLQATLNIQSPSVSNQNALSPSSNDSASKASIPKLKPPRFVPREQAMTSTPNLKRMPKSWPTQYNPTLEDNFLVGPERTLVIHEGGGMGMKLHRGTDGFVRVLSNTVPGGGSTNQRLAPRDGYVEVGDVIREVAGVDLRRPITNPMWGDTVTLIKMTKRPITFVVAPEVSTPPLSVKEEMLKTHKQNSMEQNLLRKPSNHTVMINSSNKERGVEPVPSSPAIDERPVKLFSHDNMLQNANVFQMKSFHSCKSDDDKGGGNSKDSSRIIIHEHDYLHNKETGKIEIVFSDGNLHGDARSIFRMNGWTKAKWEETQSSRNLIYCEEISKVVVTQHRNPIRWLMQNAGMETDSGINEIQPRLLAVYRNPGVIALCRRLRQGENGVGHRERKQIWIIESLQDPALCKIRLSQITTPSSLPPPQDLMSSTPNNSIVEIISPSGNLMLSVLNEVKFRSSFFSGELHTISFESCGWIGDCAKTCLLETVLTKAGDL